MNGEAAARLRFAAPAEGVPTAAMRAAFARDGFLVLEDFSSAADCAALMHRAGEISAQADPRAGVFPPPRDISIRRAGT